MCGTGCSHLGDMHLVASPQAPHSVEGQKGCQVHLSRLAWLALCGQVGLPAASPAGVHHHDELVPLGAVPDGQLDLPQWRLPQGRPTVGSRAESH